MKNFTDLEKKIIDQYLFGEVEVALSPRLKQYLNIIGRLKN